MILDRAYKGIILACNGIRIRNSLWSIERRNSSITTTEKKLFTPGPLGVSWTTKQAMLRDLGSRDEEFISIVKHVRKELIAIAGLDRDQFTCVPMQGAGTFAIESVLSSTVPRSGKVLIAENGAYGKRQMKICETLGIPYVPLVYAENKITDPGRIEEALKSDNAITHVSVVHCETSSGIMNPVEDIGKTIKSTKKDVVYFVDAMSSFGAVPLDIKNSNIDYLVSSANKCLEGVPGISFAICKTDHLKSCSGFSRSYALDLVDQYNGLETTSQFRFTPPTHVILALDQALKELQDEGGVKGRSERYMRNRATLKNGMKYMGFTEFLKEKYAGHIITSYNFPSDDKFYFSEFYSRLSDLGHVIYPGKLLNADCFRIGNIGHIYPEDVLALLKCIEKVCLDMGLVLPLQNNAAK